MQIGRDRTISPSVISIRRLPPERRRRNDVAKRGRLYTSFHFHFPQWTAALLRVIPGAVISDARVGGGPGKNRWSSRARFDEASRRAPAVSARGRSARYEYEGTLAQLERTTCRLVRRAAWRGERTPLPFNTNDRQTRLA